MTEALVGLGAMLADLVPARADRDLDGPGRLPRPVVDARPEPVDGVGDDGRLRVGLPVHALGRAALHPDGQLRHPRRHVEGALPRRPHLRRPPARRPGDGDGARLRRLRRDLRLVDRDRGDDDQGRLSVDERSPLFRRARGRHDRRRRNARHPDPAVDHHGHLRDHDQHQHRQAVRGRHPARPGRGGRCSASPCSTSAGATRQAGPRAERASWRERFSAVKGRLGRRRALRHRHGRHLRRRLHGDRGRGHRRVRRVLLRAGAARALAARAARRAGRELAHDGDAVHDPGRRADLRQLHQLHDDAGRPEGLRHATTRSIR